MKHTIETKRTARLLVASAVVGWAFLTSGSASAGSIPACATETAAIEGVDEGVNAAGDAGGDALGALGLPVSDEGEQEQLNQLNANVASLAGPLYTIAAAVCSTDTTVSTPPGPSALAPWSQGADTEPDPLTISPQVSGITGVGSSPMDKEVDTDSTEEWVSVETQSLSDPEAALLQNRIAGLVNMIGIAGTNMGTDKTMLLQEDAVSERLKTSANIKDLLANEGAVQVSMVDALVRIDESINQLAINEAQLELNKAGQEKVFRNDHLATAKLFVAP